jgi:hypothetical protein
MDVTPFLKHLAWPLRWLRAASDLPRMRADIAAMKTVGGDPLRCTACGERLKITAIRDIPGMYGGVWGEELDLCCATPGCAFTPRKRQVPFRNA